MGRPLQRGDGRADCRPELASPLSIVERATCSSDEAVGERDAARCHRVGQVAEVMCEAQERLSVRSDPATIRVPWGLPSALGLVDESAEGVGEGRACARVGQFADSSQYGLVVRRSAGVSSDPPVCVFAERLDSDGLDRRREAARIQRLGGRSPTTGLEMAPKAIAARAPGRASDWERWAEDRAASAQRAGVVVVSSRLSLGGSPVSCRGWFLRRGPAERLVGGSGGHGDDRAGGVVQQPLGDA